MKYNNSVIEDSFKMQTKQRYIDHLDVDMSAYPNILTPPMDSPDFLIFSPKSDGSSGSPPLPYNMHMPNELPVSPGYSNDGFEARLEIIEQPVDKFRFRYKSEMAGTHGSLNGRNSDRSRKQTFPSVKLLNFSEPAIIRCSLYQINRKEPHAHRLVKRTGPDEIDDPHDIPVGPDGYTANFMNMGIIHTAKKYIVNELTRKYTVLKREAIVRAEGIMRPLNNAEEAELKIKADSECNHINLNQVSLRFDAFRKEGNAMIPICAPVYSGTINNLKSALTGDLKIVRMDHCTSTTRGGREIFILVEKVTKKNIKVRFFELDEDENEVWSDYGRFSDLDVHHQYAIVFKTPAYRTMDIDRQVKVFIELQRPSDGARSEPKDFTYTPCEIIQGRKRARGSYGSSSSNSLVSSRELPSILPNFYVNSKELNEALLNNNVNSEEFNRICEQLLGTGDGIQDLYTDETISMDSPIRPLSSSKGTPSKVNEDVIIKRAECELKNFVSTLGKFPGPQKVRIQVMLESLLDSEKYKFDNGNNVFHVLILKNTTNVLLNTILTLLEKFQLASIANLRNKLGQTALHLAVQMRNKNIVSSLIQAKADLAIQDLQGNTPLHIAIMREAPEALLQCLFKYNNTKSYINLKNNEGNTALHLAIKTNNLVATTILSTMGADVNLPSNTNGYTPLHMAVADQHQTIVKFLLECECDTTVEDFSGSTALKLAHVLIHEEKPYTLDIFKKLEYHMKKKGTFEEILVKEEETVDETSDMEVDPLDIKSEPGPVEAESLNEKYKKMASLPEDCTKKVADILNASGAWKDLANRLGYGHMARTDLFKDDANPAKSFIDFVLANGENLLRIRSALSTMGEAEAVNIMDNIVKLERDC